ncbi:unnamed protein product [Schistosoma haematobium]|nr:unnamed protein product [Schistosoma haematobium]
MGSLIPYPTFLLYPGLGLAVAPEGLQADWIVASNEIQDECFVLFVSCQLDICPWHLSRTLLGSTLSNLTSTLSYRYSLYMIKISYSEKNFPLNDMIVSFSV